jgi:aspartate/methionine/tyrosine aminotransferase
MELVKQADELARAGHDLVYLALGEPDFTAPAVVQRAAQEAIARGATTYSPALGLPALREAIAGFYRQVHGLELDPRRIVVTAGASGALLLACAALVDPGTGVLMADPGYPCNRHFVSAFDGRPQLLPCGPGQRFQPTAADVRDAWTPATRGVLIASPSNPTGTSIGAITLSEIAAAVRERSGFLVVDEIYQGLTYDCAGFPPSALALGDDIVTVNSFSKYFGMTGWRLGWLVVPEALIDAFEKIQQNLFICASAVAQHAALACFSDEALAIYAQRRDEFRRRRDFLIPALEALGFGIPVRPDGAFYIYADISRHAADSGEFAQRLLHEAGVVMVPGKDFGVHQPERYVRISYATGMARLQEALARLHGTLGG